MFAVACEFIVAPERLLTDDEISDMIEGIVDALDDLQAEPSVGTRRAEQDLELVVSIIVQRDDELEAMRHGLDLIRTALRASGLGPEGVVTPHGLRSSVSQLAAV